MKINIERTNGYNDSILAISIRFFDGRTLGEDISADLAGWYEITLPLWDALDELHYWCTEVARANTGLVNDILEPLTDAQIANGCEYVIEWHEIWD